MPGASFIHVDTGSYHSLKTALPYLEKIIYPGSVFVFDAYYNYVEAKHGEYKAFSEMLSSLKLNVKYLAYNEYHEKVALKMI